MGNNNPLCPVTEKSCIESQCAWWGRKEGNCAIRILARLPDLGEDPLEALLPGKKSSK